MVGSKVHSLACLGPPAQGVDSASRGSHSSGSDVYEALILPWRTPATDLQLRPFCKRPHPHPALNPRPFPALFGERVARP